jgi:hypothetical protein
MLSPLLAMAAKGRTIPTNNGKREQAKSWMARLENLSLYQFLQQYLIGF